MENLSICEHIIMMLSILFLFSIGRLLYISLGGEYEGTLKGTCVEKRCQKKHCYLGCNLALASHKFPGTGTHLEQNFNIFLLVEADIKVFTVSGNFGIRNHT